MRALLTTLDPIKLSAAESILAQAGIDSQVFDRAAGALWTSIIPLRLMIDDADLNAAGAALRAAGFREANDGDWDLQAR